MSRGRLDWLGIIRIGLVQSALGAIVVLTTSTLNRVMVVELALPGIVPGALVALHYAMQIFRPRLGHGSDVGGRRTPWIVGGMAVLSTGGMFAGLATALMATNLAAGIALAILAFLLIGLGVGATGTTLLVLLAKQVEERYRAPAATTVWVMMIAGFIVTTIAVGHFLEPFSTQRLVLVTIGVSVAAFVLTALAIRGLEADDGAAAEPEVRRETTPFLVALREVWREPHARRFTLFVFMSMLAYSAQDLILEPFAGVVFGYTPAQSTKLSGLQQGGVLVGMLCMAALGAAGGGARAAFLRRSTVVGCLASAAALFSLACAGVVGPAWPLRASVFALGFTNGAYAVSAIGSMMALVGSGREAREGTRMGLWGAAQSIAFGAGGFIGTAAVDLARLFFAEPALAYAVVFGLEAVLFVISAGVAAALAHPAEPAPDDGDRLDVDAALVEPGLR